MNLKLRSLPLPDTGVGRGLLDLSPVLPSEGALGRPRLEVDHKRAPSDGQALLRPDARLRPPLRRELDVAEPLLAHAMFPRMVVGSKRERFAKEQTKKISDGDITRRGLVGVVGTAPSLHEVVVGPPLSGQVAVVAN